MFGPENTGVQSLYHIVFLQLVPKKLLFLCLREITVFIKCLMYKHALYN